MKIANKKNLFSFKLYKYMMNKRKEAYRKGDYKGEEE